MMSTTPFKVEEFEFIRLTMGEKIKQLEVGIDNIIEKIKFENFKNNTRCFTKLSAPLIRFFRLNK